MRCPNCNSRIKKGEDICPMCDYQINKYTKQSGIDDDTAKDYKVDRVKTANEVRFNSQFKQVKPNHSEETIAEKYSCKDHPEEYENYTDDDGEIIAPVQLTKEDVGDFNFNKYLIFSIIIMMFGILPFGLVCLFVAISAKKNYENEDYTNFASCRRGFIIIAVFSVIISVLFMLPSIAFSILSMA